MMARLSYAEALRDALDRAMAHDSRVVLLGEDIGKGGGMYTVTRGLYEKFGSDRVIDTPIAEAGFVGLGAGAALAGLRPVVEVMFIDFALVAMDQLVNQISKLPFLTARADPLPLPLVIRTQQGIGGGGGPQHSQSLESLFLHATTFDVAVPFTPADAKGLLTTALTSARPTLFLENKNLYFTKGDVPEGDYRVPFGKAEVLRPGDDLTIVSYSREVQTSREAAEALAAEGVDVEVIDLRTLRPLDYDTLLESVERTRRLMIVHEAGRHFGVGAEIASTVNERLFRELIAPVTRVGGRASPIPYGEELEDAWRPTSNDICAAARQLMGAAEWGADR